MTKLSRKRSQCPHTGADCGEEKNVEKRKRPLSEGAGTAGKTQCREGVGGVKAPVIVDEAAAL